MSYLLPGDDLQLQSRESIKKGSKVDDHLTQTQQQIKKYTLEQDLGEFKRTIFLLSKGEPIQRKSIIQSLSKIIKQIPSLLGSLFPIIKQIRCVLDLELQYTLVGEIILLVPLMDSSILRDIIPICLGQIQDWKNQKLSQQWMKLFGILVKTSIFSQFHQQALQIYLKLSDTKEVLPIKMISVRMLGHLSFFMKNRLKGTPLDRIRSFCRDTDVQMRLIIVKEVMPLLFQNLGIELINIYFMQRMFQMIYDSEIEIKVTAIDLFLQNYSVLSNEDKQRFSKIIMQHLQDSNYALHLSMKIGLVYEKVRFQLQRRSQMGSLINCFKSFLDSSDSRIRYNALYNLPGLLFYMGFKIWSDVKKAYFQILIKQQDPNTKKIAIGILPEILKIMQLTQHDEFPVSVLQLVKSLNIELIQVLMCFLEGFPAVFEILKRISLQMQCNQKDNSSLQKTLKNIQLNVFGILKTLSKNNQKEIKNNYLISKFHMAIGQTIKYMNSDTLIDNYFPLLCQGLRLSNGITIHPLLQSTYQFLYQLVSKVQILPIISQLNKILYQSNSSFKIKYIKLCTNLLNCFSIEKYKQLQFFEKCIKLIDHPVLSVRMQLALYFQQARDYVLQQTEQALSKLLEEKQISEYLVVQIYRIMTPEQKQQKKRRNSECLKNQQVQYMVSSKKKIQEQIQKKKNFIIKPGPLSYKKTLLKYSIGTKNLTSSSTSSHSIVPSISTTNRSQLRNKVIQEIKQASKSIRKIINNKISSQQQKQQIQKRKFQSVQISLQKSKKIIYEDKINERKRRKTIFQKKEGPM